MNEPISPITIRVTDKFPEPEFSNLQQRVFAELEQHSSTYDAIVRAEVATQRAPRPRLPLFRVGAYQGNELVGWSYGWMEQDNVFYMANSGVLETHRRRGIYTSLLASVRQHAASEGAWAIRSRYSVVNRPVIIAKLLEGFTISGMSQSARMGTLVELTLHLSAEHEALYHQRSLPYGL